MRVLIADDEPPKLRNLEEAVEKILPGVTVSFAKSVKSAIAEIAAQSPDLVLLDMSLPTFDVSAGEPGGRPQGTGGEEVLRYMKFRRMSSPVVIVTQYEAFNKNGRQIELSSLEARLISEHGKIFRGFVYYGPLTDSWRMRLEEKLREAFDGVSE
ncbi:response regulator [Tahibacter harae]|uniref:Response regulator n=1 Tax=Tahibacter harae TaxID=2963937 RepID=A0ABT1QV50_9GAMM|nr:response regulator [Tahibacter harae]MCQ4166164.1 response regulator [Tahibacter harae]